MAYQRRDLPNRTWKFPEERQSDYKGTITFRPVRYTPPEVQGSAISSLFRRESEMVRLLNLLKMVLVQLRRRLLLDFKREEVEVLEV